ncbi:MAG: AAA family ATPase [Saccharofermentanales bacterium]
MPAKVAIDYAIKYYSAVVPKKVSWIWYPYIPAGKITVIQGDPGDGKTTFILNIAALLSRGMPLPESTVQSEPMLVIYQSAEDDVEDTIKPRLLIASADCSKIAYINDNKDRLTMNDPRIEQAICDVNANMMILDPFQAYLSPDSDMYRATDMRRLMQHLAGVAKRTNCAIVIIGHMNKAAGVKSLYRGLGSIDISAAARSILLVGRLKSDPNIRVMTQLKNNLAPEGNAVAFELDEKAGVRWIGYYDVTPDDMLTGVPQSSDDENKHVQAADVMKELLEDGPVTCNLVYETCLGLGIKKRTVDSSKKSIGVKSIKKADGWYWAL